MAKILRWIGFIIIGAGVLSGWYFATSLVLIDPTSFIDMDYAEPHPYRVWYGLGIFFVSFAIGMLFVAFGNIYDHYMQSYEGFQKTTDPRERYMSDRA